MQQHRILSANLQNAHGDINGQMTEKPETHSERRALAEFLEHQALASNATIICTQEDNTGLVMPHFPEVAAACVADLRTRGHEANRIYVRKDLVKTTQVDTRDFRLERCPQANIPKRCVALVDVGGFRVANVFLPGGRFDDDAVMRAFATAEWKGRSGGGNSSEAKCWESLKDFRARILRKVVEHLQPDVLVGDWNADPRRDGGDEWQFYTTGEGRTYGLLEGKSPEALQAWLQWRQSPFEAARALDYATAWPEAATTARGSIAVDGFLYKRATCSPSGNVEAISSFLRMSDHAAVTCAFEVLHTPSRHRLTREAEHPRHLRLARSHTPTRQLTATRPSPPGLLFRFSAVPYEDSAAVTERPLSRIEAAMHVTRTVGNVGRDSVRQKRSGFMSWGTRILMSLITARSSDGGDEGYIWVACPQQGQDLRGASRANKVSSALSGDDIGQTWNGEKWLQYGNEDEWYKADAIREKNVSSGVWWDQVLVSRSALPNSHVVSLQVHEILQLPGVAKIIEKLAGSWTGLNDAEDLKHEDAVRAAVWQMPQLRDNEALQEAACFRAQGRR
jgi:hypothetical protein